MSDVVRRRQLAEFLRSRRARIAPETVGFARGARRRAAGLRREEVAELAGVGITWYTWLEQGRDIHASDDVIAAIARALRLDGDETEHLFSLARPLRRPIAAAEEPGEVPVRYQVLLDALDPHPAHIRDRRYDLLAWNRSFAAATGFDELPPDDRNLLWLLFTQETARELLADWAEVAEIAVALFRYESAAYLADPYVVELVAKLREVSPEFREWWSLYDVYSAIGSRTEWNHPTVGSLQFERCALALDGSDINAHQPRLHVLVPVPGTGTERRVASLAPAA